MKFLKKVFRVKLFTKDIVKKKYRKSIGQYTYGKPKIKEWGINNTFKIGNFCSISDNVTFLLGGQHHTEWLTTFPFPRLQKYFGVTKILSENYPVQKGGIIVNNDVWIGYNATILSGVEVGNGAVIGANSLVTKNVPPYAIVGGNPAKIIKYRFNKKKIDLLQRIQWWNWDIKILEKALDILLSEDTDKLHSFYIKNRKNM